MLKVLEVKPNQIDFIGVCFSIPSAPLKIVDYHTETSDGYHIAHAVQTGRFNSYMGRRVWVIIQFKGLAEYTPIAVKEE